MLSITQFPWGIILLATIAYFILGALWFTPLFGGLYDRAIGFDRTKQKKWPMIYYIGPLFGCAIGALAMALISEFIQPKSLFDASILGFIIGIGFALPISTVNAITPKMEQPILFGLVTGGYHTVGLTLVSILLYSLR
ncbi:DUF1761 domain-containing protein [Candidatus Gracilibacteria bacterium]|nr:DUF1761 domain-containing protein [Candidatus Gracilibacteria bacterium]